MKRAPQPILVSDQHGADLLDISRATFRRRVAEGVLPAPVRFGGVTRWRRDDLVAFVERLAQQGGRARGKGGA